MISLTIDDILRGTRLGAIQSAGAMQVVPVLGDDVAELAPPRVEVRTTAYGTIELRNPSELPTLVPTGAGWMVKDRAQDHAIGSAALLRPAAKRAIDTAMCIQQTQGGLIRSAAHELLILPSALRAPALAKRRERDFRKLWEDISAFNLDHDIEGPGGGHLEYFLTRYARELDEFVAEFEVVPEQVGAVVLIDGLVVGVERAPSAAYWQVVWTPLVRVCYGSLTVATTSPAPPATRVPLDLRERSLAGLAAALDTAECAEQAAATGRVDALRTDALALSTEVDDHLPGLRVHTVAGAHLSGQVLVAAGGTIAYASVCATSTAA